MFHHKPICFLTCILVVVGGLNWGILGVGGLFMDKELNVLNMLLGSVPALEYIIYILVGLAALLMLFVNIKYGEKCACNKVD